MDLSTKKRTRKTSATSNSPTTPKKGKNADQESLSTSSSESSILNNSELVEEEQQLWEDESWLNGLLEAEDSGIRIFEPNNSASTLTSSPKTARRDDVTTKSLLQENAFIGDSSKQAAVFSLIGKVISHVEVVGERALKGGMDDLWAYSIENRANIEALCEMLKVKKVEFTNLEGIIALLENLKMKSIEEKLEENKKRIPEAKQQIAKLKEVLIDIRSDSSLLRKHQLKQISKKVPEKSSQEVMYEPYRANLIVLQPNFGQSALPGWVEAHVNGLSNQLICADTYFGSGLKLYFKSVEAARINFHKMIDDERYNKDKVYVGRPSRGGKEEVWEDLQFMARVKVLTADFKRAWYRDEVDVGTKESKKVLDKEKFLEFFFKKNDFLTRQDWIFSRVKDSTSISTIYFEVALRTFDALKKYDSRNALTLKVMNEAPNERVLGVYSLVLCHSCLEHGHYYYDCKQPTRCVKCSSLTHGDSMCKKSSICPHCLRTYPPEAKHSPTDYTCPAYQEKGYKLQKLVKCYKGGY